MQNRAQGALEGAVVHIHDDEVDKALSSLASRMGPLSIFGLESLRVELKLEPSSAPTAPSCGRFDKNAQ